MTKYVLPLLLLASCVTDHPSVQRSSCQISLFYFSNVNMSDTTQYLHGPDGRMTSFRRVSRLTNGTIIRRNGELSYNAQGLLDQVIYPLTNGVLTLLYQDKHLTRLEYRENGTMVQEYDVTTDPQGRLTSMTGKGQNNTRVVYTLNEQGYVSLLERFDQAGNRLLWMVNTNFAPHVLHPIRDVYAGIPVFIFNSMATVSFDPQPPSSGPWQHQVVYNAMDAQGNYNGVVRESSTNTTWTVTKEGYPADRLFSASNGTSGSSHTRYTNCQ